ncbi:alpha-galactosidase [Mucilaginibacter conchicola]|uniref:Alpha-galactosidase n=1 Tax=Mucilaginibacter conchicola TaxID=2303333 RepID=A0A372NVU4_9SPHI|nr:alpha-galactosidase [Mucilaginibacter conchicola]RFZ94044.1 alpha-galactosidase [Mucilaginibacter conchicola]
MLKNIARLSTALCLLFASIIANAQKKVSIPFGKDGRISYDLSRGTFDTYQANEAVFKTIYADAKVNDIELDTRKYLKRSYTKERIKDGFGNGYKHTITLTADGLQQMKQVFYTYDDRGYFFTEISFTGAVLKSNNMHPINGGFVPVSGGDLQTVFVPFDNDTFISYQSKAFGKDNGVSAEVGTVYSEKARGGLVAGSIEHGVWKTGVSLNAGEPVNKIDVWAGYTAEAVTRDKIAHGIIEGNTIRSPRIMMGYFADWRKGMEEYGKANRIADPPAVAKWTKPTPVGWNSWGVIQEHISLDKAKKVVDFFADSIPAFRTGKTAYIDLDSYWDKLVHNGDYAELKEFVTYCRAKGLEPGVYWAPFTDWGHGGGPNRKVDGSDYTFGDIWTKVGGGYHDLDGARAIDPTHPGTKQRIAYIIGKLKACGFSMIKIDFLGHAAIEANGFYDKSVKTGMEAYRKGMEYLISQTGKDMLIYAAISPSLATGRYTHMRRIACDAFKSIDNTQYTLNSVTYGWWQTYLYDYLDADHVVFNDETEGANRARLLSALITGTWLSGDDLSTHGQWSERIKKYYEKPELLEVVKPGKAFRPVDGNTGKGASAIFSKREGNVFYVAAFNYGKQPTSYSLTADRLGINFKTLLNGKELLQNNPIINNGALQFKLGGADAALYKFTVK